MTETKVWVKTEASTVEDGSYVVTLEVDDDTALTLTREVALRYALGILDAAQRAAYDAAVMRQLTHVGVDYNHAAHLLNDLREDRGPLDAEATAPLSLTPGVSAFDGSAFLHVIVNGKAVGQWNVEDATSHALGVLEVVIVAELDGAYYRAVTEHVQVEPDIAQKMIHDLANFREASS